MKIGWGVHGMQYTIYESMSTIVVVQCELKFKILENP